MQTLVLCLDISESMAYGEPAKLEQAIEAARRAVQSLSREALVGLITFDVMAEILLDLKTLNRDETMAALRRIMPRGVTCLAAGLTEAIRLLKTRGQKGEILLLTDGRANLSLNRMGGFEGSLALEEEVLKIVSETPKEDVTVHTVAVGEDAFTHTLVLLAQMTKGRYWLMEDFQGLTIESPKTHKAIRTSELNVHSAPAELPSAQPTWTKESQLMHVSVVSQSLYELYRSHRRSFLVNPVNGREVRTALISIETEALSGYRERLAETTSSVRAEEAILIDRNYRDYLILGKNSRVRLVIC
ncbi:MAG: VWA domain-containing protein [Nitrososphaerota archaeon]